MAINETISTGRKFRKCVDNTPGNKKWLRYSFWTKASDVEFNDGANAETKFGSYKGVTTNENQVAGFAADITLVKSIKTAFEGSISSLQQTATNISNLLNSTINRFGGMRFYEDATGKYVVGADSVPKKLGSFSVGNILHFSIDADRIKDLPGMQAGQWGKVAEFNLQVINGWQSFELGKNVVFCPARLSAGQTRDYVFTPSFGALTTDKKETQSNSSTVTYDTVTRGITDSLQGSNRIPNPDGVDTFYTIFGRYNPATGKLIVWTGGTFSISSVTIISLT